MRPMNATLGKVIGMILALAPLAVIAKPVIDYAHGEITEQSLMMKIRV